MPLKLKVDLIEDTITAGLPRFRRRMTNGLRVSIHSAALRIESTAKASLVRGTKSGRLYRKTKSGKMHRASAPGEPPASDTGDLLGHISVNLGSDFAEVGSEVLHGLYLETGAPDRNLKPRPWLLPALQKHEGRIEADIIRELSRP